MSVTPTVSAAPANVGGAFPDGEPVSLTLHQPV
jgi:hypothetical protein